MPPLIDTLLASPDGVEVVRDQIGAILLLELTNQGTLGLSPVPRVFIERSNPWGVVVEPSPDERPIINVWWDASTFDGNASTIAERQRAEGIFNIDAYAFALNRETAPGHAPADAAAAFACQKTLRLARQILMSAFYTYLGLRGLVWRRWPQSITMFQPPIDLRASHHVVAGRLALAVQFNEVAPQVPGEPLETLSVEVFRASTGELLIAAEYPPFSPP